MKKLGEGLTAIVYTDGQHAYKKYKGNYSKDNMVFETYVQNQIFEHTHLNVVKYEIIDDSIRMTLLTGKSLADRLINENYIEGFEEFIQLQLEYFKYEHLQIADSYETFQTQIKACDEDSLLKELALISLSKIKHIYHLCHFDYHPENIVYHEDIPYIIDWTNAKLGNPVMDIASTYIIFQLYAKDYATMYLKAMFKAGFDVVEIQNALPVMAFIRYRETEDIVLRKTLENFIMNKHVLSHES